MSHGVDASVEGVQPPADDTPLNPRLRETEADQLEMGDYAMLSRRQLGDRPLPWSLLSPHIDFKSDHV